MSWAADLETMKSEVMFKKPDKGYKMWAGKEMLMAAYLDTTKGEVI